MTQTTDATPESKASTATAAEMLDQISLEQALIDVEVANARVIDLTGRLAESHLEAKQLRQQMLELSVSHAPTGGLRALAINSARAVARCVLPIGVRTRLRSALR